MIEWTHAISTGVPLLDEHHQNIFAWLAELESAALDKRTLFSVYALVRLKHYTRDHFAAEEALMKSAGFPGLTAHMAEHAAFRVRLGELQIKSMGQDISTDTVKLLSDWLTHHITKTDMAYVPYMRTPK